MSRSARHRLPVPATLARGAAILVTVALVAWAPLIGAAPATADQDGRLFPDTGFRVDNDQIWDYFSHRGRVRTFGMPTSRTFQFMGAPTQFFQREVVQATPSGVRTLNLLDAGLLPYTAMNGSTLPSADPALAAAAPAPGSQGYDTALISFVRANAPDTFESTPVRFFETFASTVTLADAYPSGGGDAALLPLLDVELWGLPTSRPTRDPKNDNFVYQRFQRGIMHYDAACKCTQGLLLADYLKAIITGEHLPDDLAAVAAGSPLFKQYDPTTFNGPLRRGELAATNLANAFRASDDNAPVAAALPPTTVPSPTSAPALPSAAAPVAAPTVGGMTAEGTITTSSGASGLATSGSGGSSKPSSSAKTTPSAGGGPTKQLDVTESEWSISPSSAVVAAGKVAIKLTNTGAVKHEMVILQTDKAPDALPMASKKDEADEAAAGKTIGEFGALAPGASNSATFDMAPGHYVLVCNITGHYKKGMSVEITAQ